MKQQISTLLTCGFLFLGLQNVFGQANNHDNFCGTEPTDDQWEQSFQKIIKQLNSSSKKTQSVPYTIPVIIHVIHGGQAVGVYPNLAQGQLNSQIQVLNEDFGGIGYNSGNYPITAFNAFVSDQNVSPGNIDGMGRVKIADCNIQFCLATMDTLGNLLPEPGIDRINYLARSWANPASFGTTTSLRNFINGTVKPQTVWNVSKYLNIWITDNNINANNLLGYATFPPLTNVTGIPANSTGTSLTDGYWCYAKVFGSKTIYPSGTYYGGYDRGRVSTHEIGHWVGLRHIGGDAGNTTGDCAATDFCNDTPPQKGGYNTGAYGQNFGSPPYPLFAAGASSCPLSLDGCMFMNFMDYTDDGAKYMYTTDQAARIQAVMADSPYRKFLGTHNLCSVADVASVAQFKSAAAICQLATLTLSNTSFGTPVPSYTWSSASNVTFLPDVNSAVAVIFNTPGTHVITLTTDNGTQSVFSKTIVVNPAPNLVLSVPSGNVCRNDAFNITASGGSSYVWLPGNVMGGIMEFDASADESFTCVATGAGGCKTTIELELKVMDCTGIKDLAGNETIFSVYPNPSQGLFTLRSATSMNSEVTVVISDVSGKKVSDQKLSFSNSSEVHVDLTAFTKGLYLLKLITGEGTTYFVKLVKE